MDTLQIPARKRPRTNHLMPIHEDTDSPVQLMKQFELSPALQESAETFNSFTLSERESQGRRTKLRVSVDVYARNRKGDLGFQRLRNKAVLLSCPSAEQAEIAIDIIRQVCASMHGKHLTRR